MIDFKKHWWKILLLIIVIIVIIIVAILVIRFYSKSKEKYTTSLNSSEMTTVDKANDPLQNYVNSWINSVKTLYSTKSVLATEKYAEPRTIKNFNKYTYLDKDAIVTGVQKY